MYPSKRCIIVASAALLCANALALAGNFTVDNAITFDSETRLDVQSSVERPDNLKSTKSASNHSSVIDNVRSELRVEDVNGWDVTFKRIGPDPNSPVGFVTVLNTVKSQLGKVVGADLDARRTIVSQDLTQQTQMDLFFGNTYVNNPDLSGNFVYSDAQLGSFGEVSLATLNDNDPAPLIVDFDGPDVHTFSFLAGDFGGSLEDDMKVIFYEGDSGAGNVIATVTAQDFLPIINDPNDPFPWTQNRFSFSSSTAIGSVAISVGIGDAMVTHSAFYDNFFWDSEQWDTQGEEFLSLMSLLDTPGTMGSDEAGGPLVPEPSAMSLLLIGAFTAIASRRRQRR